MSTSSEQASIDAANLFQHGIPTVIKPVAGGPASNLSGAAFCRAVSHMAETMPMEMHDVNGLRIVYQYLPSEPLGDCLSQIRLPSLTTFELMGVTCTEFSFLKFLQNHQKLTELKVNAVEFTEEDEDKVAAAVVSSLNSEIGRRYDRAQHVQGVVKRVGERLL